MTTTPDVRQLLRDWMETHDDVQAARAGEKCIKTVWVGSRHVGDCGQPAAWVINYGLRVPKLGRRPHCEAHAVEVIQAWTGFEVAEARKKAKT